MKRILAVVLLSALAVPHLDAARVVRTRTHRGHVTRVRVTTVRPAVRVRVAPRVYLGPVAFTAIALASLPPAHARATTAVESINRREGWTEFTMNFDQRGRGLVLEIDRGPAQISYAEVVFDNGDAQVVDFDDRVQQRGVYSLLDFRDGRKVDHVRIIAQAQRSETVIRVHLTK